MQVGSVPGTEQVVPSTSSFYRVYVLVGTDPQRCRLKLKPAGGARPRLVIPEQRAGERGAHE